MSGSCLALVADDQRLASAVQAYLQKHLGQQAFHCKFETIRNHIGRETDGLLVLASNSTAEVEQTLRLVQDVYLQKFPPVIILLEGENVPRSKELSCLEPHVACRLRWPEEAAQLTGMIRERLGRARPFLGTRDETLEDVIASRLLAQTPSLL